MSKKKVILVIMDGWGLGKKKSSDAIQHARVPFVSSLYQQYPNTTLVTCGEAVGLPEVWQLAVKLLRRGGVVNFFGGCPEGTDVPVDAGLLHYSELTLKASFHHTPVLIRQALDIISRGRVTARDFVNRVEPLSNLLEVMQHLMSHNGHLKTAIIP